MPAIAAPRDGGFLILGKVGEAEALVQHPLSPRPALMSRADLEAIWDGLLILMTPLRPARPVAPLRHHLVRGRHP